MTIDVLVPEPDSPEARYERLVANFLARFGIGKAVGKGFGGSALQVEGRIFAMLTRGRLVVKLPKPRVDALIAEGRGARFDANRGTPMKEWLSLSSADEAVWLRLAEEAMMFVRGDKIDG